MIKLLGAALLIGGTSACGISGAMRLRRRARVLAELVRALAAMRGELVTRLAPVPELIERAERQSAGPVGAFFRNVRLRLGELGDTALYELWSGAVGATPELMLTEEEAAVLREAPRALGRYDLAEQRDALLRAERRFEEFVRRADAKRDAEFKTRALLGAAAGVFVALLLL
ncbi:MAG: stage III sporulation protein AB [Oscillospiraceae bacterium]|jgi:stage III sporulation protein AB|nr:stage III sporulation protein AB [Oscillospiraceae bacterium]